MSKKTSHIPEQTFLEVLDDASAAADGSGVPYGYIGSIATAALGEPGSFPNGEDIDLFVRAQDAGTLLEALGEAGFATDEWDHAWWLHKAMKRGVVVDVIFESTGGISMDEEMTSRVRVERFKGRKVNVVSPEDLVVMKAVANQEEKAGYWHEALAVLARQDMDWDYMVRRAEQYGVLRVLSLLVYAQSLDLDVPADVLRRLIRLALPPERG
jgi:predicted nucleotidyltransferase